jgi:transcriptional regulator with XRE-family HTH domain
MNVKVIKALESDSGNPHYDSLAKMAAAFGLRVAFVKSGTAVELLNPDARATQERHRRQSDAQALASGRVSAHELHERNALRVDDVHYELPNLV